MQLNGTIKLTIAPENLELIAGVAKVNGWKEGYKELISEATVDEETNEPIEAEYREFTMEEFLIEKVIDRKIKRIFSKEIGKAYDGLYGSLDSENRDALLEKVINESLELTFTIE